MGVTPAPRGRVAAGGPLHRYGGGVRWVTLPPTPSPPPSKPSLSAASTPSTGDDWYQTAPAPSTVALPTAAADDDGVLKRPGAPKRRRQDAASSDDDPDYADDSSAATAEDEAPRKILTRRTAMANERAHGIDVVGRDGALSSASLSVAGDGRRAYTDSVSDSSSVKSNYDDLFDEPIRGILIGPDYQADLPEVGEPLTTLAGSMCGDKVREMREQVC